MAALVSPRLGVAALIALSGALVLRAMSGRGYDYLSAPSVGVTFFWGYGLLGYLLSPSLSATRGGVSAVLDMSNAQADQTLPLFLTAGVGIALGSMVVRPIKVAVEVLDLSRVTSRVPLSGLVAGGLVPLALIVYSVGPGDLWLRQYYLVGTAGGAFSLGKALVPVGVLAVTVLALSDNSLGRRALGTVGLVAYTIVLFALGTRLLALVPTLVAAAYVLSPIHRGWFRTTLALTSAAVASFFTLSLPLALRGLSEHGLYGYATALLSDPISIGAQSSSAALSNVMFGYPLTYFVANVGGGVTEETLKVSVNPLPGGMTDWYSVAPYLRLNDYTPYNAIGELGHFGVVAVFGFFLITGLLLAWLWRLRSAGTAAMVSVMGMALTGTTLLICVTVTQYNLRSSSRLLYYLAAIGIAVAIVRLIHRGSRVHESSTPDRELVPA